MVLYRRNYIAGGTFFFTVALRDRRSDLLLRQADLLKQAIAEIKAKRPFSIEAMVVMPEHLHAIWTLPEGDADYSGRWRAIKSGFVRALTKHGVEVARNARGEAEVWQRRFWEHTLRDENDFNRHVDYIHYNPVKHGYVTSPASWPHSSIHRFIERGVITADWGANMDFAADDFGEAL
ncbi:transposase [Uliginosibacterium paludis]|uniref:Transposase n=1 Tax=Uliginosibacterium paludis TaxID=1615952 RepID=A0ABV2CN97_9RHOO